MLNSKLHKICQPLISELKFWNFPLFYRIIYAIYVNKRYLCPKNGKTICYGVLWILQPIKTCKEKLVDFDALDEVSCPPQMECETN